MKTYVMKIQQHTHSDAAKPVSYTHLDVYKRQPMAGTNSVFRILIYF